VLPLPLAGALKTTGRVILAIHQRDASKLWVSNRDEGSAHAPQKIAIGCKSLP
jgi:hypothetical protein